MIGWVLLLGLASLVAGILIVDRSSRHPKHGGADLCPSCGYAITGLPAGTTCPECGASSSEMEQARIARVSRRDVLAGPIALCGTIYILNMAIGLWPAFRNPGGLFLAAAFGAIPYASLGVVLWVLARRITPAAAWALSALALAAFSPLLTFAFYQTAVGMRKDAMAGVVFIIAPAAAAAISGFGLLIGAVVVQHPFFKKPPMARRKSTVTDGGRIDPAP